MSDHTRTTVNRLIWVGGADPGNAEMRVTASSSA